MLKKTKGLQLVVGLVLLILLLNVGFADSHSAQDIGDHWAKATIKNLIEIGIMDANPDGDFRPDALITRGETIQAINRAFGFSEKGEQTLSDVTTRDDEYDDIMAALYAGYITGYEDQTFRKGEPISRQEMAAVFYRLMLLHTEEGQSSLGGFKDRVFIPEWSREYLNATVQRGYLGGYPDGTLQPEGMITRAEFATLLKRVVGDVFKTEKLYGGNEQTEETFNANVLIAADKVQLAYALIEKDLFISEGIGDGEFKANHVAVKGKTIICGGGEQSIYFTDSKLKQMRVHKRDGELRIVFDEGTSCEEILFQCGGKLELQRQNEYLPKVIVDLEYKEQQVCLDGMIGQLETREAKQIEIASNSKIQKMSCYQPIHIVGKGNIETARIYTDGVVIDQPVRHIELVGDATAVEVEGVLITQKDLIEPPSVFIGGGGGGGSSTVNHAPQITQAIEKINNGIVGEAIELNLNDYFADPDGDTLTFIASHGNVSEEQWSFTSYEPQEVRVQITAKDQSGKTASAEFDVQTRIMTQSIVGRDSNLVGGTEAFYHTGDREISGSIAYCYKPDLSIGKISGNYFGIAIQPQIGISTSWGSATLRADDYPIMIGSDWINEEGYGIRYIKIGSDKTDAVFFVDWDGTGDQFAEEQIIVRMADNLTLEAIQSMNIVSNERFLDQAGQIYQGFSLFDEEGIQIGFDAYAVQMYMTDPMGIETKMNLISGDGENTLWINTSLSEGEYTFVLEQPDCVFQGKVNWKKSESVPYRIQGFNSETYRYYAVEVGNTEEITISDIVLLDQFGDVYDQILPANYSVEVTEMEGTPTQAITLDCSVPKKKDFLVRLSFGNRVLDEKFEFVQVVGLNEIDRFDLAPLGVIYAPIVPDPIEYGKEAIVNGYIGSDGVKMPDNPISKIETYPSDNLKVHIDQGTYSLYGTSNENLLTYDKTCVALIEFYVGADRNIIEETVLISPLPPASIPTIVSVSYVQEGEIDPTICVRLDGAEFVEQANQLESWQINLAGIGLHPVQISTYWIGGMRLGAEIQTLGTAKAGFASIQAKTDAIDKDVDALPIQLVVEPIATTESILERDPMLVGSSRAVFDSIAQNFSGAMAYYLTGAWDIGAPDNDGNYFGLKVMAPEGVAVDSNWAELSYITLTGETCIVRGEDLLDGPNYFYFYPMLDPLNPIITFTVDWDGIVGPYAEEQIDVTISGETVFESIEPATLEDTGVEVNGFARWMMKDESGSAIIITEADAENLWVSRPGSMEKEKLSLLGDMNPALEIPVSQATGSYVYFVQTMDDKVYEASCEWTRAESKPYAIAGLDDEIYEYYAQDAGQTVVLSDSKLKFEDQYGNDYDGSMPSGYKIVFSGDGDIASIGESVSLNLGNDTTYDIYATLYNGTTILDEQSFSITVLEASDIDRFEVTQLGKLYAPDSAMISKYGKKVEVLGYEGNDPVKLPNGVITNIQAITHTQYLKADQGSKTFYATSNGGDLTADITGQVIVEYNVSGQVNVEQQTVSISPQEPLAVDVDIYGKEDANLSGASLYVDNSDVYDGLELVLTDEYDSDNSYSGYFSAFFEVTDQYGVVSKEVINYMYVKDNMGYSIDNGAYTLEVGKGTAEVGDEFTIVCVTAVGTMELQVIVQ